MNVERLKKVCFAFLVALLIAISAINIFSPKTKEISERENRKLNKFPEISIKSLFDGDYFMGIEDWFSDNIVLRDELLNVGTRLKAYLLLDTYIKSKDSIVYIPARRSDENFGDDKNDIVMTTNEKKLEEMSEQNDRKNTNKTEQESKITNKTKSDDEIVEKKKNVNSQDILRIEEYMYDDNYEGALETIGDGYIFYNDAIYSDTSFSLPESLECLKVLEKYKKTFNNARTSLVIAPTSTILLYGNKNFGYSAYNQNAMVNKLIESSDYDINIVNPCKEILDHRNEYIYFKYDHHWTNRGAYYAYKKMCESLGEYAPALSSMSEIVLNEAWVGSAYDYTNDIRLYGKTDQVIAYISTRSNVLKVTLDNGEERIDHTGAIRRRFVGYSAFISGDNPFTEINVPSNNQDKCALVIKDSFGCAFVPYLVNNYGNIYVIDPRHTNFNIVEKLKDKNIVDIIAVLTLYDVSKKSFIDKVEEMLDYRDT